MLASYHESIVRVLSVNSHTRSSGATTTNRARADEPDVDPQREAAATGSSASTGGGAQTLADQAYERCAPGDEGGGERKLREPSQRVELDGDAHPVRRRPVHAERKTSAQ